MSAAMLTASDPIKNCPSKLKKSTHGNTGNVNNINTSSNNIMIGDISNINSNNYDNNVFINVKNVNICDKKNHLNN